MLEYARNFYISMKKKEEKVVEYYHPVLRKKAREVKEGEDIESLVERMEKLMKEKKGVGLAATQIGELKRVILVDTGDEGAVCFINPVLRNKSSEKMTVKEGCLSLPGIWLDVERSREVTVEFVNQRGEKEEIRAEGMLAVVLQHEIDHLDGILFVDKAGALEKVKLLLLYFFRKYARAR